MTVKIPESAIRFCASFQDTLTKWQSKVVPRMIVSILMSWGRPNYSVMAGRVLSESRNKSSLSRFFCTNRFNPDQFLMEALRKIVSAHSEEEGGVWFLVLDGTATRRGGFTKIGNAIKYREKTKEVRGGYPSTKAHMFLMGILLGPGGVRFPLPALPYYTKEYCRKNRMIFKTQVELAAQMIAEAPVPSNARKVVVLGDEYYEGETVHRTCEAMGYTYIMPTDSRRCLADKHGHRTTVTLHGRGRHLSRGLFKRIVLVEGQESTAAYRRLSEPERKNKRVYRAFTEDLDVAGLGAVRVAYSWKNKNRKSGRSGGETYKVLVCNDTKLSVGEIVEYYELRWQIELFFREMKSVIGFNKFRGNSFKAYARFVGMVLLSFLFLEWMRMKNIRETRSRKLKAFIARERAKGMIDRLQEEIDIESIDYFLECTKDEEGHGNGRTMLMRLLRAT